MNAFVTGSTGLLGNDLVRLLVEQGARVTGLVRSREKAERLPGGLDVRLVEGDMRDVAGFAEALDGVDVVFHAAASGASFARARGDLPPARRHAP